MRVKQIASMILLLIVSNGRVFSQTEELQIGKPKPIGTNERTKDAATYNIVDVIKTAGSYEILYSIAGTSDDEYDVTLLLRRDSDPNFLFIPARATGKIGVGHFAGAVNSIVWDYRQELPADMKGNDYRFDLRVRRLEQSSFPWLWTGLGVAAGGVAAILLLSNKGDGDGTGTSLPEIGIKRPQ